jgi:hypothetical protein
MIWATSGSITVQDPAGLVMTLPILAAASPNRTVIERGVPMDVGDHWVVPTEMVALELSGDFGTSIRLSELRPSTGQIIGSTYPDTDFPAESFFDVFVEVDLPGLATSGLQHAQSIRLEASGIDQIPPLGARYETPNEWAGVELLSPIGEKTGYLIQGIVHIMPPPPPEWEVLECECMEHDPGHTYTVDDEDCPGCADLNCDDEINFKDFAIMASQWLTGCPE